MNDDSIAINPWMLLPFGALLVFIALAPLAFPNWWGKHYLKVVLALSSITLAYYFFGLHAAERIQHTAHEYAGFITLIGSLYVVAGGIHLRVKARATPIINVIFLFVGAIISNLLGTTGASMLLIRPWLRMNKSRVAAHHVVFFIFIISNVGGCLTPIGDPPLFLGYLLGVPFWWVAEHCWPMWAVGIALLLVMFFVVDYRSYLRFTTTTREDLIEPDKWHIDGLGNIFFLAVILAAVFIHHPPFLREGLMILAALGSYFTTRASVHKANDFNFHPLQEVVILFVGIFATMMPALDWLRGNVDGLEHVTATFLYWGTGSLSSALDNAPTYLCFLKAVTSHFVNADIVAQVKHLVQNHGADLASVTGANAEQIKQTFFALQKYHPAQLAGGKIGAEQIEMACLLGNVQLNKYLVAVSVGAVFFGANTYIANGPNFMVKSIADREKVPTPDFLSFIWKFTLPFMAPTLLVVWWLFFRP